MSPSYEGYGSRWRFAPDLLALIGGALLALRFCRRVSPQVSPDTAAYQEENEPRRRGQEYLDDPLDPIGLPERRDGEREDQRGAQSGEDGRNGHHANSYYQAQTAGTHPAPLQTHLVTVSSIALHYTSEPTIIVEPV